MKSVHGFVVNDVSIDLAVGSRVIPLDASTYEQMRESGQLIEDYLYAIYED